MTEQSREYLKTRFEAGDTPTGQDFIDLLDSVLIGVSFVTDGGDMLVDDGDVLTDG